MLFLRLMRRRRSSSFLFFFLLGIFFLVQPLFLHSFQRLSSFGELPHMQLKEGEKGLLILDLHSTLIWLSSSPLFSPLAVQKYRSIWKGVRDRWPEEVRRIVSSREGRPEGSHLMEKEIPCIIRRYQEKGWRVVVFTTSLTHPEITGAHLARRINKRLGEMGIQLTPPEGLVVSDWVEFAPYLGGRPLYGSGVVVGNKEPKGKLLIAFLQRAQWWPDRIVMVDDLKKNLHSVEEACCRHGLRCNLFLYRHKPKWGSIPSEGAFRAALKERGEQAVKLLESGKLLKGVDGAQPEQLGHFVESGVALF